MKWRNVISEGLRGKRDVPDGLWMRCDSCEKMIYRKVVEASGKICPECSYHFILTSSERIESLLDEDSFQEELADLAVADYLGFKAKKTYTETLEENQSRTNMKDSALVGRGRLKGLPVIFAVTDSRFMMGSMGAVLGEKIAHGAERAIELRQPYIVVSGSGGGARMQEGLVSLMQMAKTSEAIARMREEGVPFISVLTNPTMAGVLASFASLGDVVIAEPKALIGFTGPRVIQQTIKKEMPPGFQSSEFLLEHGMIDMIVSRLNMKERIAQILTYLKPRGN
jgi:acetyl-CoA carboxylase carboxyl transferase subunit beta